MRIREATKEDLTAIFEIETKSFSVAWSKDSIEKELNSPITLYLVAEKEGEIVGYIGSWKILQEVEITNLAVAPSFRGQGIGKELLKSLLERVKKEGMQEVLLEVRKSNRVAKTLYESLGFTFRGIRKGYYQKPTEDALILGKKLG